MQVTAAGDANTPEAGLGQLGGPVERSERASAPPGGVRVTRVASAGRAKQGAAVARGVSRGSALDPWCLQEAASAAGHHVRVGGAVSWVRCPRVSAPRREEGIGEGPTKTRSRSGRRRPVSLRSAARRATITGRRTGMHTSPVSRSVHSPAPVDAGGDRLPRGRHGARCRPGDAGATTSAAAPVSLPRRGLSRSSPGGGVPRP